MENARKSGTIAEVKRFDRSCGNYSHHFYEVYHHKISADAQYLKRKRTVSEATTRHIIKRGEVNG